MVREHMLRGDTGQVAPVAAREKEGPWGGVREINILCGSYGHQNTADLHPCPTILSTRVHNSHYVRTRSQENSKKKKSMPVVCPLASHPLKYKGMPQEYQLEGGRAIKPSLETYTHEAAFIFWVCISREQPMSSIASPLLRIPYSSSAFASPVQTPSLVP